MPPPPEEENDWPQWRRLGIILLVCLILNVTFGALVLVTTPSAPPPFEHKQMELTSPRPLVIYPDLPEEVRWWARITTKSKGFQFNATTIYYWDTTTMKSMTSTSTTSTSMTSTTTTRTSTANTSGSTASMINTSTTSTTKPEAVEKVVIYRPAMDVSRAFTWVIGGGMVKITYPGMSWKRRHQHPVRSKFRTSQKAIEPSDTAEYPDTGYFKEVIFQKSMRKATLCPLPNSNLTKPILNAKGVLIHNTYWLCGGLEVNDDLGELEHTSMCYSMGVRQTVESTDIKGWTPTLDLRIKLIGHSIAKKESSFFIHNFGQLYHIQRKDQEIVNIENRFVVETIDLPFSISYACLVNIGNNLMAVIGGMNATGPSEHMTIYDIASKTFREGPKLNLGRSNHACYVHYQEEDEMGSRFAKNMAGKTYIGVYGGMQHFHIMKSTEFLFSDTNQWQVGPNLFRGMMDATAVYYFYNRGVVLSGGVGTSGGYVTVLLDIDEDGSLVWGQHHLVMSRTVMSPTGVIYEKPALSYPSEDIYTDPTSSVHMKSAHNPNLKMRFDSYRKICTYQFINQVQIMGNLAAYDYKKSNVYHKVFNLRPLLYILMKLWQGYIFDWRVRDEPDIPEVVLNIGSSSLFTNGVTGPLHSKTSQPEHKFNFDWYAEEYIRMQQDALLDDEIKDRWEMADAVKRKPDAFINEYGKMYPNFTESYRPHGYHNMVNATGLFQFIQTTLGTQRGHHDDFAWAQHFATSFPYGGNSNFFNKRRHMFNPLHNGGYSYYKDTMYALTYFVNKMYARFSDQTQRISQYTYNYRYYWLRNRADFHQMYKIKQSWGKK